MKREVSKWQRTLFMDGELKVFFLNSVFRIFLNSLQESSWSAALDLELQEQNWTCDYCGKSVPVTGLKKAIHKISELECFWFQDFF